MKMRNRALSLLLCACMLLTLLPAGAFAASGGGTVTVQDYNSGAPAATSDYDGLITHSDADMKVTFKNDGREKSLPWSKSDFTHNGNVVWQSNGSGTASTNYSALAMLVDQECYLVYDYIWSSSKSSSFYHNTAASLSKTSGSTTYSPIPNTERNNYVDEQAIQNAEWKTAVIDLTDINTTNRVLWLEHRLSKNDISAGGGLKHAYISNIQIFSKDNPPEEYTSTISIQ